MQQTLLPLDWAFRPSLDVELKHYTLLAYLQRVQARFSERKLYPHLHELRAHMNELLRLKREKETLGRSFHGDLLGFDPLTGEARHEALPQDPLLDVVDDVIDMALPDLHRAWKSGFDLREEISSTIRFAPVGVLPLAAQEGWLLLRTGTDARAYHYSIPLLRTADITDGTAHVRTRYVTTYTITLSNTIEHIKGALVSTFRMLPNPAVFAFETDRRIPYIETFMPLAKQLVYEEVSTRA